MAADFHFYQDSMKLVNNVTTKTYQRQCKGKCEVVSSQQKATVDELANGEIVTCPIWKCICCGHEEKRIVRTSEAKTKTESFLESKLNQMLAANAAL